MQRKNVFVSGMVVGALAFVLLIVLSVYESSKIKTKNLKLLHIVFNHAASTPGKTYPNDPYINETLFPVGWGQLSNQGKLEAYYQGVRLRKLYDEYLGSHFSIEIYNTQTTDLDKTKTTAQCINAGLWPPDKDQKWGALNWQPIPVHAEPLNLDTLLKPSKPCPQYYLELANVSSQNEDVKNKLESYKTIFEVLTNHTGEVVKDFNDVKEIYKTLKAEEAFGLALPSWSNNYYPNKLIEPTVMSYIYSTYSDKLNRLTGGVFLKKIITDWKAVTEGKLKPSNRKAFLYVGEEEAVVYLMRALGVWDLQLPNYAMNIQLELYQDSISKIFGVEIYFQNVSNSETRYQLTVPSCEAFCPLDRLIELTEIIVPENWEIECSNPE